MQASLALLRLHTVVQLPQLLTDDSSVSQLVLSVSQSEYSPVQVATWHR